MHGFGPSHCSIFCMQQVRLALARGDCLITQGGRRSRKVTRDGCLYWQIQQACIMAGLLTPYKSCFFLAISPTNDTSKAWLKLRPWREDVWAAHSAPADTWSGQRPVRKPGPAGCIRSTSSVSAPYHCRAVAGPWP